MSQHKFKIILQWDQEEQVFNVSVPALSGCVTFGKTKEEAVIRAQEAIEGYIEASKAAALPIPGSDVEITEVMVNA